MTTNELPLSGHPPAMPQELLQNPAFLLVRLGASLKEQAAAEFASLGFSHLHYAVLALLDKGSVGTQLAIAETLDFDKGQVVALLELLEREGLVERRRDPEDRRRHIVSLTAAGRRQLATFRGIVHRLTDELLAPLDPGEREVLRGLLSRLAAKRDARYSPDCD
jgi:DNA-binding MarR family transcriptional regulator